MKKLLALLLTLTLSLGLLAGCGGPSEPAPEEEPTSAQSGTEDKGDLQKIIFTEQIRGYHWAPAYLAQTLGYFAEEGLDAEFQTIKGGDATTAVLSGDAQFCLKGIETALMVNEAGQGCKVILSATQKYPYQLIDLLLQQKLLVQRRILRIGQLVQLLLDIRLLFLQAGRLRLQIVNVLLGHSLRCGQCRCHSKEYHHQRHHQCAKPLSPLLRA